ncbi:hypothetical protein PZB74_05375 [Porifericola rhodea]|uniref:hypothetical protein n=1 Tax=Porifericola rhodea TaxID=930972 RepID=UPI002666CD6A|nr:hypothetical protein [Porifericola rhodea]WKN32775.1 hypothetical protein PZB74_05375 [Porifericola rhodea]
MDILKKILLITFYVSIIAVGIIGFIALRSLRQAPPVPHPPQEEVAEPTVKTDSLSSYQCPIGTSLFLV